MLRFVAATAIATVCGMCCPTAPSDATAVMMRPAEVRDLSDVRITFVEVRNDSRCPVEVVCAWAGNAEVVVTVQAPFSKNMPALQVLNTTLEPRSVTFAAVRVQLDSLKPPNRQSPPITQSEYAAYFTVTRLSAP